MENLMVGAFGWNQAGWLESFYPEDMPEDWRLDYYSQFFKAVLVPETEWQSWTNDDIDEIVEALEDETFYFVFDVVEVLNDEAQARLMLLNTRLGTQAYGLLCHGTASVPASLNEAYCVTYVTEGEALPERSLGWSWPYGGVTLWGEPLGYVSSLSDDGKQQAEMLKCFMQSLPEDREGALFLVGESEQAMASLKNLKVVGELLGY
ncbi:hypothetical protein AVO42_06865 [Thiomicrospira sp. XS5]|uniref:hypothetical protein n=1 Tax=Thiomicrospira sp. XS5 TaxID=1775636 RepID=UPI0007463674|nr:hypothetical protein [Thiomicrospira sp. XS5]KUJ75071.1 hypothetical protein AVO42_06865 [Thiomicrospira sp. XS5]